MFGNLLIHLFTFFIDQFWPIIAISFIIIITNEKIIRNWIILKDIKETAENL